MSTTTEPTELRVEDDVLELVTIAPPRRKVSINGKPCELVNPEELSLVELQRFSRDYARIQALWAGEKLTKTEVTDAERILNELLVRLIDGATLEDVEEIPAMTRQTVVLRFFVGLNDRQLQALDAGTQAAIQRLALRARAA